MRNFQSYELWRNALQALILARKFTQLESMQRIAVRNLVSLGFSWFLLPKGRSFEVNNVVKVTNLNLQNKSENFMRDRLPTTTNPATLSDFPHLVKGMNHVLKQAAKSENIKGIFLRFF
jgi:hypothetical protein